LLPEKIRTFLRGPVHQGNGSVPHLPSSPPVRRPHVNGFSSGEVNQVRQSRGLEQFFSYFRDQAGLSLLDLGGISQENVSFITNLGHRIYSEDFLRTLYDTFGDDVNNQLNPGQIEHFLNTNLMHHDEQFDGVLVWDALEHMSPPLLTATVERLYRIVRPKSYLLAFFHADEKAQAVPYYGFRILDCNQMTVSQRGVRQPAQLFNNRGLEKLFHKFESVKFFLTREHLREVIIKR
jgi:hypothetical protein